MYFCLIFNPVMDKTFNAINKWGIHTFCDFGFLSTWMFVSLLTVIGWSREKKLLLWAEILEQVLVLTCQMVTLHIHALSVWLARLNCFYLPDLPC